MFYGFYCLSVFITDRFYWMTVLFIFVVVRVAKRGLSKAGVRVWFLVV